MNLESSLELPLNENFLENLLLTNLRGKFEARPVVTGGKLLSSFTWVLYYFPSGLVKKIIQT